MAERRREGVKTMSDLVLHGERAVETVVHDVHAGEGELGADLVRDARVDRHFKQRAFLVAAGRPGNGRELRDGVERRGLHAGAGAPNKDEELAACDRVIAELDGIVSREKKEGAARVRLRSTLILTGGLLFLLLVI